MTKKLKWFVAIAIAFFIIDSAFAVQHTLKYTQTSSTQEALNPEQALKKLQIGNANFLNGKMQHRNYIKQSKITSKLGQAPFAVVLSCMDSRGPVEILFDQGIGDIFSLRVAGNVINQDIVGSMEYGTKVVGSKLVLIMGHTQCGAVEAACKATQLGNLTNLLNEIKPAVSKITASNNPECSPTLVDRIAKQNVLNMMQNLKNQSQIIANLANNHDILIIGAMHDLRTGKVSFFDEKGNEI